MPKCPNCGREAARTEDWACQWCGYPLLSESYEKIPKTYKQLKEESLYKKETPLVEAIPESSPPNEVSPPPMHPVESEPKLAPEPKLESMPESVTDLTPELESESKPEPETKSAPKPKRKVMPKSILESTSTEIELTAEELYSAYAADEVIADEKLTNKMLKVTGLVDRIVVNDTHDIYYIILTTAGKEKEWNVRCSFDRKHVPELNHLTEGQMVTVQGEYDGYKRNILMRDCVLVH